MGDDHVCQVSIPKMLESDNIGFSIFHKKSSGDLSEAVLAVDISTAEAEALISSLDLGLSEWFQDEAE